MSGQNSYEKMMEQIRDQERRDKYQKEKKPYERKPRAIRRFERYSNMGSRNSEEENGQSGS